MTADVQSKRLMNFRLTLSIAFHLPVCAFAQTNAPPAVDARQRANSPAASPERSVAATEVDARDERGWTALMNAVTAQPFNMAAVLGLLRLGADPNLESDGETAMTLAVDRFRGERTQQAALLGHLIAAGGDVNAKFRGDTLLHLALGTVSFDPAPIVRVLIDSGADLLVPNSDGGGALQNAATHRTEVMRWLLDAGLPVDARDERDRTPLMLSAYFAAGAMEWAAHAFSNMALLLKRGADPNAQDADGETALHAAFPSAPPEWPRLDAKTPFRTKVVVTLLRHGAKVDLQDEYGRTALHAAAAAAGADEVLHPLLRAGARIDAPAKFGGTPLIYAARVSNDKGAAFLLKRGADADAFTDDGTNALMVAAERGSAPIVGSLLKAKADVNVANIEGEIPLMIAAQAHHRRGVELEAYGEIVEALARAGADCRVQGDDGRFPLQWAAGAGSIRAVAALLRHGADPNATDPDGNTALSWAEGNEHTAVVKLLRQAP